MNVVLCGADTWTLWKYVKKSVEACKKKYKFDRQKQIETIFQRVGQKRYC